MNRIDINHVYASQFETEAAREYAEEYIGQFDHGVLRASLDELVTDISRDTRRFISGLDPAIGRGSVQASLRIVREGGELVAKFIVSSCESGTSESFSYPLSDR